MVQHQRSYHHGSPDYLDMQSKTGELIVHFVQNWRTRVRLFQVHHSLRVAHCLTNQHELRLVPHMKPKQG
eukprot:scaffold64190_cov47-Prasinocladus_malaysianus.AAC.1